MPNLAVFHVANELRRFRRARLTRISVVALVLIPLLYSALYLWAFWNPLNSIRSLPVALVNSDQGAEMDGQQLRAGDEVVNGLHDNDQITWSEVSAEEAAEGVKDGTYYFSLELPENFSRAVTSVAGQDAQKAQLIATYNDANGYLSTIIGQNVMREVLNAVGTRISAQAVDKLLIGVLDAGTGLEQATDGAGRLADGTGQLKDGTRQLVDQVPELRDGTGRLADGLVQLKAGASRLSDGTQELNDKVGQLNRLADGVNQLGGGVDRLGEGATQLSDGVAQLTGTLGEVTRLQGGSAQNLRDIAGQLRALNVPAAVDAADRLDVTAAGLDAGGLGPASPTASDLGRLTDGAAQLAYQLSDPNAEFRGGMDQLVAGTGQIGQLIDGVGQINDGAHLIDDNLTTARDGARQIADGTVRLSDGAVQLDDGATRLDDGAHELHDRLGEGVGRVPTWNEGQRVQAASTIGGPVDVDARDDSGPSSFGTGLAPFFVSLALFIGGIVVFQIFRPLQQRAIASGLGSFRAAVDGFVPVGILAVLQALVIVGVSVFAVGLDPRNLLGFTLVAVLAGAVFMAVNQALIALLGSGPGRVTSLAALMVMAVTSGGIYPVQTQNRLIELIHPLNPMTYAVDGLRQTLYGVHDTRLWVAVAVLVATLLGSFMVTTVAARLQRTWSMTRLHPVLPA